MKKILVPCDFSKAAINAFEFATNLAEQSQAVIHLIHVIEPPLMNDTFLMPTLYFEEEIMKDLGENAQAQFKKLIEKNRNISIETHIEFGFVNAMIEEMVSKQNIDLIIMGSQGASGLKEAFVGSHAEKIVRTSPVPVIVLKEAQKQPIRNIVFPNTLELDDQEDLVQKVKELQDLFKAHLNIVWINTPLNFTNDDLTKERLTAFAKRFMLHNYSVHVFSFTDNERGVIAFNKSISGDLIAMGTHGRKGLAHLFNGSITEDVVNHVKCPIWTYVMKKDNVLESENAR